MDLRLHHVDDHLAIVEKPPGLVVHPAPGHSSGTLLNGLLHALGPLPPSDDPARPGIVHRLDRDTSGLLLVARDAHALEALSAAIARREVARTYLLLATNALGLADIGEWETAYGRHPRDRKRFSSRHEGARRAKTRWRVIERVGPDLALCEASLVTGRTHQIRVHFADHGHPLVGDAVYGHKRSRKRGAHRQFLHATRLELTHPRSGEALSVESPLPDDLEAVLSSLRRVAAG